MVAIRQVGRTVRLFRIIEHFQLPVTIWDCDERDDLNLSSCQVIDMPMINQPSLPEGAVDGDHDDR